MEVLDEKAVPAAEARNSLRKKDEEGMSYEQKICIDFLKKNVDINVTDVREAMKELQDVGRIKGRQAAMIINTMPGDKDDMRLLFSKERTSLSDDQIEAALEVVDKYRT